MSNFKFVEILNIPAGNYNYSKSREVFSSLDGDFLQYMFDKNRLFL